MTVQEMRDELANWPGDLPVKITLDWGADTQRVLEIEEFDTHEPSGFLYVSIEATDLR